MVYPDPQPFSETKSRWFSYANFGREKCFLKDNKVLKGIKSCGPSTVTVLCTSCPRVLDCCLPPRRAACKGLYYYQLRAKAAEGHIVTTVCSPTCQHILKASDI